MSKPAVIWFRRNLRLSDNQALIAAATAGEGQVIPIFIHNPTQSHGGAHLWWLSGSLRSLDKALGGCLNLYLGQPEEIIPQICAKLDVSGVYWQAGFREEEERLATRLAAADVGIPHVACEGALLWPPESILRDNGEPYKVFTPFYRHGCLLKGQSPRPPLPQPGFVPLRVEDSLHVSTAAEAVIAPRGTWSHKFEPLWERGEAFALKRLQEFIVSGLPGYKQQRDFPAQPGTSHLSPHLSFGEISPHQVWHAVKEAESAGIASKVDCDHFLSELGWREFSYYLLHHFPFLPYSNFNQKFDAFPWLKASQAAENLEKWQHGQTGYPLVDAGMRELWSTGYMHNRVRMVVASFLVKNLLVDWREGAAWFMDCLVDADLANNSASWQWVAGSGVDAAPYFRIFNPLLQGEKFDPNAEYIKRFVPELRHLDAPAIHRVPLHSLASASPALTKVPSPTYPTPIVDLGQSRLRALAALKSI